MKLFLQALLSLLLFAGCSKPSSDGDAVNNENSGDGIINGRAVKTAQYTKYTIRKGEHYCDQNTVKMIKVSQMNFMVKFDNTAMYQTIDPVNQYDINKLYGFSEGNNHQYNSARIGWAWNDGALRLYAYAYNNGIRQSQEITTVAIGSEISCSISLSGYNYIFTVNGVSVTLPRASSTSSTSGYQLYPYFGGDEVAPNDINIWIKNI